MTSGKKIAKNQAEHHSAPTKEVPFKIQALPDHLRLFASFLMQNKRPVERYTQTVPYSRPPKKRKV